LHSAGRSIRNRSSTCSQPVDRGTDRDAALEPSEVGADAKVPSAAERRSKNPEGTVAEAAHLLHRYGVFSVRGDRYSAEWSREAFRKRGIAYEWSELDKSALFLELLPIINSGTIELPDDDQLLRELRGLERRRGSSGRDRVDHRAGEHDDRANVVAGVAHAVGVQKRPRAGFGWSRTEQREDRAGKTVRSSQSSSIREASLRRSRIISISTSARYGSPPTASYVTPSSAPSMRPGSSMSQGQSSVWKNHEYSCVRQPNPRLQRTSSRLGGLGRVGAGRRSLDHGSRS
jgi:hypothetical protein